MKLELSNLEREILRMALVYNKGEYFAALDQADKRGPSIIHPGLVKRTYNNIIDRLEKGE